MGSIMEMINSMSVGGRVAVFLKCVCVYFLLYEEAASPSAASVAAKCAPVLCLLALVLLHHASLPYSQGGYCRRVAAGLALSALGDALLAWPALLAAGMAAFGAAHAAYLMAFGWRGAAAGWRRGAGWAGGAAAYCLLARAGGAGGAAGALLAPYALLLAGMAWRAGERGGAARAGALLFVLSDAVLGYSLFVGPVPLRRALVMTTYYLGQLGIALSALLPPRVS